MKTIHSLAPEILSDIFELAHDPREPSTMCSAALVCRAWRDPAQRVLFLDISVKVPPEIKFTPRRILYLRHRLHTPRRVELVMTPEPMSGGYLVYPRTKGDDQLRWCKGATEVILYGLTIDPSVLCDANLQDTRKIDLREMEWVPSRTRTFLAWPQALQSLTVTSIRELAGVLGGFRSLPTLRHLKISIEYTEVYDAVNLFNLKRIPPSVTECSLVLLVSFGEYIDRPSGRSLFEHLSMVTNLEIHFYDDDSLNTNRALPPLCGVLPLGVRRLSFIGVDFTYSYRYRYLSFSDILNFISTPNLPNLARLDFPECKRATLDAEPAAADVLVECDSRAIRVVCWEDFL